MTPHPPSRLRTSRLAVAATAATICAAVLAGCSSSGSDDTTSSSLPSAPAESTLAGTCPDNVVVQLQWQPQSDMAGVIGLLGPGYTVDTDNKSVSGPLVFDGMDTGVDITLRAGGPAIGPA